ncbi:hypothetical protein hamaS1_25270 [Moorella sp. Hama-1]|nr:hypothetical protein hamaS1_25270 [Moorella sp. Hama-1]
MNWLNTTKSQTAKERWNKWGGRGAKVSVLTRGDMPGKPGKAGNPDQKVRLKRQELVVGIIPWGS